jgi:hypothetical protein
MKFNPERLAYWFLRLNGFLTTENFIVHDEKGGPQRTDADLLAVRLPHRREALHEKDGQDLWMEDYGCFAEKQLPFGAFVEVTNGHCKLNGPWTDPKKGNLARALRALGALAIEEIQQASDAIYKEGHYQSGDFELGLVSIGAKINQTLAHNMPGVVQITWNEVKAFIFERFDKWEIAKRPHPQWDRDGHQLWRLFQENRNDQKGFASSVIFDVANTEAKRELGLIREGKFAAEVPVELIEEESNWSPYLDEVRLALRSEDVERAATYGCVFELRRVAGNVESGNVEQCS